MHGFTHALFAIAESSEPILEIDAAIVHQFDMVARNTCIEHMRDHFFGIHMLCSAIAMANHHDVLHAQLEDRDEQGTDHTAEGVRDHAARILDDLGIAVLKAERCRKQLGQARIHAAQYCKLLLRILIGFELFVALLFNEGLVERKDFFNGVHSCSF